MYKNRSHSWRRNWPRSDPRSNEGLRGRQLNKEGIQYETVEYDVGGDRYLATGEVLPESVLEELTGT